MKKNLHWIIITVFGLWFIIINGTLLYMDYYPNRYQIQSNEKILTVRSLHKDLITYEEIGLDRYSGIFISGQYQGKTFNDLVIETFLKKPIINIINTLKGGV